MELKSILSGLEGLKVRGNLDVNVKEIKNNSKAVEENDMFVAIKGFDDDGHNHIVEAIKNGALVSRTIDGVNDPNFSITINNLNSDVDVTYTTTIIDQKGQEINLGSFSTEEERLTAVQDYCDEQIRLGNMTKEYAENLINDFQ